MNFTRGRKMNPLSIYACALVFLHCIIVAAGSDVTMFEQDDDHKIDDSVRTLMDLDFFNDGPSDTGDVFSNNEAKNDEDDNISDSKEKEADLFSDSDNTLSKAWEERTNSYSKGYGSFSSRNSSSRQSDADLDATRQFLQMQERENEELVAEEMFIPVPAYGDDHLVLSRVRRDLVAGSGEILLKTTLTLDGTATADQLIADSPANLQLRTALQQIILLFLTTTFPGETFRVEVTLVRAGSIIIEVDIIFNDENLTIVDLARAYDSLALIKSDTMNFVVLDQTLANEGDPQLDAICYLCVRPQTCQSTTVVDGTLDWFCETQSDYYFPFGFQQGDSTLTKGQEFATAVLEIDTLFPYKEDFVQRVYVSVNGIISFDEEFSSFNPQRLPFENRKLLAPYWSDLDILPADSAANVFYQLYTRSPTSSASQLAVFNKANADVVAQISTRASYDATHVIVATWEGVPPWPGTTGDGERVHFQVAIITDGQSTYVTYVYAQGGMNFKPVLNRAVVVGWGDTEFGTGINLYTFDLVIGDTNMPGYWFFEIGAEPNSRALCRTWFEANLVSIRFIAILNFIVPACPCNGRIALISIFWLPSFEEAGCYDMFPLLGSFGRRCCYRQDGTLGFESRIPLAGSLQLSTPYFGDFQNHENQDVIPKRWCCDESNLCNLYYAVRPARRCIARRFRRSFLWGDPHVKTLDGLDYIFNGLGEYTIMNVQGQYARETEVNGTEQTVQQQISFKLQGRTCRSTAASGNLTSATQWCAIAGQISDNSTFNISIGATANYMEIYVRQEDYTSRFQADPNFGIFNGGISLRRVNNSVTIFTPDDVGVTCTLSDSVIELSIEVPDALKSLASGLMGNFNDDISDDLVYSNGTQLPAGATEEQIFGMGQSWAITQEESLFVYPFGTNTSFYSDPNFTPIFLDQVDNETKIQAEIACGSTNPACVFDYIATDNQVLALQSANAIETFDTEEEEISNQAPNITEVEIETSVGEATSFTISATDPDNDNIQYIIIEPPTQGELTVDNTSGVFMGTFTPNSVNPVTIGIVAQDSRGLQSEISVVTIRNCGGCNGRGNCSYNTTVSETGTYYSVSPCNCETPYSGDNCQNDKNGCANNPCPSHTTCTDIPAEDELALRRPYNCSDCPIGYELSDDGTKCVDIDECVNGTSDCDVNANCTNTVGSHICTCKSGFRKSVQTNTCADINECIENNHRCTQICTNTVGSVECDCNEGFMSSGDGTNCTQVAGQDPCAGLTNNCTYGCRNDSSAAECFCQSGFQLNADGFSCDNVDECGSGLCSQDCTDTIGSFVCSCYTGFALNEDQQSCDSCPDGFYGMNCEEMCECRGRATSCDSVQGCLCRPQWTGTNCVTDVNECLNENVCPEDKLCANTNGSFTCSCPVGYEDANNDGNCTDINECASVSIHQCSQNCRNNPGSFQCFCEIGYTYNSLQNSCDDINECEVGTSGCEQICENTMGSLSCICQPGYVLDEDRKNCFLEQNLCVMKEEPCEQDCTIIEGVPTCLCRIGFFLGVDGLSCLDINECEDDSLNQCSDFCNNVNATYTCTCPSGKELQNDFRTCTDCDEYHWGPNCQNECACDPIGAARCDSVQGCICNMGRSGDQCQNDINECNVAVSPCPDKADCIDTVGSFICRCRTGYQLNSLNKCEDINECSSSPCDHICNNTVGSYICSCFPGFNSVGDSCNDINECEGASTSHGCSQICRNTQGSFVCECYDGFLLNTTDRRTCNEEQGRTVCGNNTCDTACRVQNGNDICYCDPGFEFATGSNDTCTDINECKAPAPCVRGLCVNVPGAFNCSCEDGFRLLADMRTCQGCDEGTYGKDCDETCTCVTDNSLKCLAVNGTCRCKDGYTGGNCASDVNECTDGSVTCPSNSRCINTPGSYQCLCDDGFVTSNSACVPCSSTTYGTDCASQCPCVTANTANCNDINGTCTCEPQWTGNNCSQDVNECADTSRCSAAQESCENIVGSFTCVCDSGYTRISDQCVDVNECLTTANLCNANERCENTIGSYTCLCASGFVLTNGQCVETIAFFDFVIVLQINDTALSTNYFISGTAEFQSLANDIAEAIRTIGFGRVGVALFAIRTKALRRGSVRAEIEVQINEQESNNTAVDASRVIKAVAETINLNVSATLTNIPIQSVFVRSVSVVPGSSVCIVFDELGTCTSGTECIDNSGIPTCVPASSDDDDNFELIIGLGVGIPLFILLVVVVAVAVYLCIRKQRKTAGGSTPSVDRDQPFRSVFARQMATKTSLASPHRFSMYSPDAYSEAGTSESSGDGQLLKSRQKVRSDFQDSPWYDNRGATPRDHGESQGAPTEAGAGPTSNFSWEYMFKLLEPHRGFEIQRPNLSPAPNPTYTPRGKKSESPA